MGAIDLDQALPAELAGIVKAVVRSGDFDSTEDYICDLVRRDARKRVERAEQPDGVTSILESFSAYQHSAALSAAVELDLVGALALRAATVEELATTCRISKRGAKGLADYLVVMGLFEKEGERYSLARATHPYLDPTSPQFIGYAGRFLASRFLVRSFEALPEAVKRGGSEGAGLASLDHPDWAAYAQGMAPVMLPVAEQVAARVLEEPRGLERILDLGAGHGLFGIELARSTRAEVIAMDSANVLQVAERFAQRANIADRYSLLPGDAFNDDLGDHYDAVVVGNLLHHFDQDTNVTLLRRVKGALVGGGVLICVDFVLDEDQPLPEEAVALALALLCTTPSGQIYTEREYESMIRAAGFETFRCLSLEAEAQRVILANA